MKKFLFLTVSLMDMKEFLLTRFAQIAFYHAKNYRNIYFALYVFTDVEPD